MSFLSTKYTRVYSCPDDIKNLQIRMSIKEVNELKKEERNEDWHRKTFKWQEKVFNKFERGFYKNVNNCLTDLEKKYHQMVTASNSCGGDERPSISSYINEDDFSLKNEANNTGNSYLCNLVQVMERQKDELLVGNNNLLDFETSVVCSVENPTICSRSESMWIVADFGHYIDETWFKREELLCVLKYNKTMKTISIFPDFTINKPYILKIDDGETLATYLFFIENISTPLPEGLTLKENELIKKILQQKTLMQNPLSSDSFILPPKNKLHIFLFFEILSGKCFEYSNIYVQYFIDLPENWKCHDGSSLSGLTQTCCAKHEDGLVHFGHCFTVQLEYNVQEFERKSIPESPYIYFEVISKDYWDRYRTEGLTYKNIPVSAPGSYFYNLCCFRLRPQSLSSNLKRFFIGDCSNFNDITWIGLPKDFKGGVINKYGVNTVGTGQLNIRLNVIHQSQAFMKSYNDYDCKRNRENLIFEKLNSSSLIKSVEQVLQAFKRARKNMLEARKNL